MHTSNDPNKQRVCVYKSIRRPFACFFDLNRSWMGNRSAGAETEGVTALGHDWKRNSDTEILRAPRSGRLLGQKFWQPPEVGKEIRESGN